MSATLLLEAHRGLNEALRQLALGCGVKKTLYNLIELAENIMPQIRVSILSYDPVEQTLNTLAAPNLPEEYNQAIDGVRVGPTVGSCGKAAFYKESVFTENVEQDPNWQTFLPLAQMARVQACWSVPILSSRGNLLGTFAFYHDQPKAASEYDTEFMTLVSSVASVAIEKDEIERELYYAATHDALTGVANRHQFCCQLDNLLAAAKRHQTPLALYYIDINNFKKLNDNFGHSFGDKVLIKVATALKSLCRDMDVVGRLGGDEFVLMCPLKHKSDADTIHTRLLFALQQNLQIEQIDVVASIGRALWFSDNPLPAEQLIADADQAMYRNKLNFK
ncbi:diguanylate cyclase (GGDEF) domain-containing protein [Ferrimonas sediminum]|uniref:Diguanylate cyclase (GGDEF) domain-containing protein n=1 Tax=Ferrimonas sediminum TaxID=718193 RepID=A0A1G8WD36_9GAMM|nr:diguanylate cyclase (GGDEF) domain-containing protein [Ferrimonas sediminum]